MAAHDYFVDTERVVNNYVSLHERRRHWIPRKKADRSRDQLLDNAQRLQDEGLIILMNSEKL